MYRLMLYFLIAILVAILGLSTFNFLPYNSLDILIQALTYVFLCWGINRILAKIARTEPNPESSIITALILSNITGPFNLLANWNVILVISLAAMASKYIFEWNKSHVFNPAAVGAMSGIMLGYPASWWIGNVYVLPVVLIGGYVVLRKIRRFHLFFSFAISYLTILLLANPASVRNLLLDSALIYFAVVMLIEPLTSPQNFKKRVWFGIFVAAVLIIYQRLGLTYSLELSLLSGNIFARILSPDFRSTLVLKRREKLSSNIYGFWFDLVRHVSFKPGQYLEWTLDHAKPDKRGIRRFFTIASSPTEKEILLATRISDPGSTFKKELMAMDEGQEITVSKISGDFVMPKDKEIKIAFIAGGIGITPFRSMVKYMLDEKESRDIYLLYAAKNKEDFVFQDIFSDAEKNGLKTIYIEGAIDTEKIETNIPDYLNRIIYVSGPEPMVEAMSETLRYMGVKKNMIKTDFFPGYTSI